MCRSYALLARFVNNEPDLDAIRDCFLHQGRLSKSDVKRIIKEAMELFYDEDTMVSVKCEKDEKLASTLPP